MSAQEDRPLTFHAPRCLRKAARRAVWTGLLATLVAAALSSCGDGPQAGPSARLDRVGFIGHLDSVRRIRNDVMHFDPEGLTTQDTERLEDLARFFRDLVTMGAI